MTATKTAMKKVFSALSAFAIFAITVPSASFAQTSSIQAQLDVVADLTRQIQTLQQQLLALQQQQQQATAQLVATLAFGSQGDQVKILQTLLAADAAIYPEGLITGFFGRLTGEAVKRFQKKHGIEIAGIVGPRTLKKINELFKEDRIVLTTSTSTGETLPCVVVPPGHLIAPGWLKNLDKHTKKALKKADKRIARELERQFEGKHGGDDDDEDEDEDEDHDRRFVRICPPGIFPNPTSTVDVTLPVISAIGTSVTTDTATVTWVTNEASDSQIVYGLSTSYGSSTVALGLVTAHSQTITRLTAGTTYHFQVKSKDAAGNLATSADGTFTTATGADTTTPIISAISVSSIGTTNAMIMWTTNEAADSQVSYGTTTAHGSTSTLDSTLVFTHIQAIAGLTASTTYHFQVRSKDASGNLAVSSDQTFTTIALADTTTPVISALNVSVGSSTANVSWTTNEAATGKVYYSTVTPLVLTATSTLTISDGGFITSHAFTLTGLSTSTTYFYVVESADVAVNRATSAEQSFTTNP